MKEKAIAHAAITRDGVSVQGAMIGIGSGAASLNKDGVSVTYESKYGASAGAEISSDKVEVSAELGKVGSMKFGSKGTEVSVLGKRLIKI